MKIHVWSRNIRNLRCLVQDYKEQALLKKIIDKEIRKRAATDEAGLKSLF